MRINSTLFCAVIIMTLTIQTLSAQSLRDDFSQQKVMKMVANFEKTFFYEGNPIKAIELNHILGNIDDFDIKAGFKDKYADETSTINEKHKSKYFTVKTAEEISSVLRLIQLGSKTINKSSCFDDYCLEDDPLIKNIVKKTKHRIESLSKEFSKKYGSYNSNILLDGSSKLEAHEKGFLMQYTAAYRFLNKTLILKNLRFINQYLTEIEAKKVSEKYYVFEVKNRLFNYKIRVKDGIPKIMSVTLG